MRWESAKLAVDFRAKLSNCQSVEHYRQVAIVTIEMNCYLCTADCCNAGSSIELQYKYFYCRVINRNKPHTEIDLSNGVLNIRTVFLTGIPVVSIDSVHISLSD